MIFKIHQMEKWSPKSETELKDLEEEKHKDSLIYQPNWEIKVNQNIETRKWTPNFDKIERQRQHHYQLNEFDVIQNKISLVEQWYTTQQSYDSDLHNQIKSFWWWAFEPQEYGLTKHQVNMMLNNLVEMAVGPKIKDSDLNKNTIYLKLLQNYEYEYTTEVNASTGNFQAIYWCRFHGCDRKFTRAWNLLHHARIHRGEKPYLCQMWTKQFAQKGNLKKHISVHLFSKRSKK